MVADEISRRGGTAVIGGKWKLGYVGRIAETPVGDDAGNAALPQSPDEDIAPRGAALVLAAVDDEHVAGRAFLDRPALELAGSANEPKLSMSSREGM